MNECEIYSRSLLLLNIVFESIIIIVVKENPISWPILRIGPQMCTKIEWALPLAMLHLSTTFHET